MELVGSTSSTSLTLFKHGIQRKLVVTGLRASTRNATVYACRPGMELSRAQLDVMSKASAGADERGYHVRRAIEHIAEIERIDQEERKAKS